MTLPPDYQALRQGAAVGTVAARGHIAVTGADRASWLQGLLTNDIQALTPGTGCYAAWLTPQGRMITDLHVLESGDMMLLDVPEAQVDSLMQRLDQFVFAEDVQIANVSSSIAPLWVHGPQAPEVVQRLVSVSDAAAWPDYRNARFTRSGEPLVLARIDQLGVPGFCIYAAPSAREGILAALRDAGALPASRESIEAARIEAGYPVFGLDLDDDVIPLEAGIEDRAISFTKGCYVGQEIVIRVLHRGGGRVARKLVALKADGRVAQRSQILDGDRVIGRITSSAMSPRIGPVALGYVHRDFVEPGSRVTVDTDGTSVAATVTSRPIP